MLAVALLIALALLVAVTVVTRRPSGHALPDFDVYLQRWSAVHDGYDAEPTRVVRRWLHLVYRGARPLAVAGVRPDVLTGWSVWLAVAAVAAVAAHGTLWLLLAALLIVASGFGDGLDGAVAVLTDRATAWGYVLDSLVDRVTEALFLVAAWVAGAPGWLAVSTGTVIGLLEYLRARAGNAGAAHVAVITVGERPQRVICCAIAVGLAGLVPGRATAMAGWSVAILLALTVVGLAQLTIAVHRMLR